MNEMLINRLKSFAWRLGMAVIAFIFAWVAENIGLLELSPAMTGILALVLGEVSKALNTRTS